MDPARLPYQLKTTVEAYDKVGQKNPKWDAEAKICLTAFAHIRSWTNDIPNALIQGLQTNLLHLAALKCGDPLIHYLYIRFIYSNSHSSDECATAYREVATDLREQGYPDIRTFYATVWVWRAGAASMKQQDIDSTLERAASYLAKALEDPSLGLWEVDETCDALMTACWWVLPTRWNCYRPLELPLTNRWKGSSPALLTKGRAYLSYAWQARGTGYANTVTESGWKMMAERLSVAAEALESAWRLSPTDERICLEMMRVELGQGKGYEQLERWFQRGMKLNPASYDLCYAKLEYLRPRWYGSMQEMIDFGRECTMNTNWMSSVRLMLADAHYEAAREILDNDKRNVYWSQRNVWSDIEFTFTRFFKLYPKAVGYRNNYARYAARCGQWQEFLNQVEIFSFTNYAFFGGEGEFNSLLNVAKENVENPKEVAGLLARAYASVQRGDCEKAIRDYREAIRLNPKGPQPYNDLAWLLATSSVAAIRDGKEAVELAKKACDLDEWKHSASVDTLAAAFAEAGDFEKAIKYQNQALSMADVTAESRAEAQQRLDLYQRRTPYHETIK
jgi:tetratricopeptide (TPR) repeat protein